MLAAFVRETPVWAAPVPNEVRPPPGEKTTRVQAMLASPSLTEMLKTGDPFLDVLGNMLVSYSKRRLPPPG
jgi:hypothetical protein